jgi:coenzyme F420-reducing hydrogenase delta subunit
VEERRGAAPEPFEPRIVALCCHYCAYGAADLAGSLRQQYPATARVVRLRCTGNLEVALVLEALERGADGVMVAGCLEGDCHFQQGNLAARRRVERICRLLEGIGTDGRRVRMFHMSSAMAQQWAAAVSEMDETVRALGPNPLRMRGSEVQAVGG